MSLIDQELATFGFAIGTPREPARRGGHVALEHEDAVQINQALKDRGVLPDFRPPNIIRLAPVALYTSFHEVYKVVQTIQEIVETGAHRRYSRERETVA
jgi:kynureninase